MWKYSFFLDVEIGFKIFYCDLCLFRFGLKVCFQRYLKPEQFFFFFLMPHERHLRGIRNHCFCGTSFCPYSCGTSHLRFFFLCHIFDLEICQSETCAWEADVSPATAQGGVNWTEWSRNPWGWCVHSWLSVLEDFFLSLSLTFLNSQRLV